MIKNVRRKKIIIIGAGLAGLSACTRLLEYGFDAIILEARHRCGGRVSIDNTLGMPFGLGANWIHGIDNNPMTELAKQFHAEMVPLSPHMSTIFDRNGKPVSHHQIKNFNDKFHQLLKRSEEIAYCVENDVSLASVLSVCVQSENLSSVEWDLFRNKLNFIENYIGANYDSLSARHWSDEETWPGANCFLTTGYEPIIAGLSKNCCVKLNTRVTTINLRKEDVEIVSDHSVFYADAVIVTVPLGVLKKNVVTFSPPLPEDKQNAIARLGMGLLNITVFKFPTAFWPKEPQSMFFNQFSDLSISAFFNLYHFTEQPILIGYVGGKRAQDLEDLSDNKLIEKTMYNFKKHFGHLLPEPESYLNTRWARDPFSYGSYSYLQIGSSGDDYDAMAKPVSNKLFFAGEATCSKYFATTHGAYLSGIREAERINRLAL